MVIDHARNLFDQSSTERKKTPPNTNTRNTTDTSVISTNASFSPWLGSKIVFDRITYAYVRYV